MAETRICETGLTQFTLKSSKEARNTPILENTHI